MCFDHGIQSVQRSVALLCLWNVDSFCPRKDISSNPSGMGILAPKDLSQHGSYHRKGWFKSVCFVSMQRYITPYSQTLHETAIGLPIRPVMVGFGGLSVAAVLWQSQTGRVWMCLGSVSCCRCRRSSLQHPMAGPFSAIVRRRRSSVFSRRACSVRATSAGLEVDRKKSSGALWGRFPSSP